MLVKGILSTKIVIFSYPKLLLFSVHKMKINTELCCKRYDFLTKKDPKLSLSELLSDDNIQFYSYGLLCEHVLSMRTV